MSLVFLHSADWQLGKPFASVRDDAKRHRLQQERLHAVQRLAKPVKSSGAAYILVAGDSRLLSLRGGRKVPLHDLPNYSYQQRHALGMTDEQKKQQE